MTNSVTGFYILDSPSVANITLDLIEGTQINIGALFTVTIPGGGVVLIDAGRIMFEEGAGAPVFIAGPHLPTMKVSESFAMSCACERVELPARRFYDRLKLNSAKRFLT